MNDVVYIVRPGHRNEELRYSLRSLRNLPHRRVWIVGHLPNWVSGVQFVKGNRFPTKWRNVYDNLRLACEHVPSRSFVVMNDDFYITSPVERLPSWHRGPLEEHVSQTRGQWRQSLEATLRYLRNHGISEPLSYELHVPVLMERAKLRAILGAVTPGYVPPQWRTLYGNWWKVPSEPAPDVKLRSNRQELQPLNGFLSTEDWTFARVLRVLREMFPEPSPYERAEAVAA